MIKELVLSEATKQTLEQYFLAWVAFLAILTFICVVVNIGSLAGCGKNKRRNIDPYEPCREEGSTLGMYLGIAIFVGGLITIFLLLVGGILGVIK